MYIRKRKVPRLVTDTFSLSSFYWRSVMISYFASVAGGVISCSGCSVCVLLVRGIRVRED